MRWSWIGKLVGELGIWSAPPVGCVIEGGEAG